MPLLMELGLVSGRILRIFRTYGAVPGSVQIGIGCLQNRPGHLQTGFGTVQTVAGDVQAGFGCLKPGSGCLKFPAGRLPTGSGTVQTGRGGVRKHLGGCATPMRSRPTAPNDRRENHQPAGRFIWSPQRGWDWCWIGVSRDEPPCADSRLRDTAHSFCQTRLQFFPRRRWHRYRSSCSPH